MRKFSARTIQYPRPLPAGNWQVTERWNNLLLAHWPVSAASIAPLLPEGLEVDTFQGSAWIGVAPFWMDRIKIGGLPLIPGWGNFPELSLRTYVHDQQTRTPGIHFLSLETNSLMALSVGRALYHLPSHLAEMRMEQRTAREFSFYSRRRFSHEKAIFKVRYRGLGPSPRLAEIRRNSLEYFLIERYCLFSSNRAGRLIRANLHHLSAPLEEAEAEIEQNDLASAIGIELPNKEPVLHYTRRLAVYVWPTELVRSALMPRPVTAAVTPS
jgi:hypothetical protein